MNSLINRSALATVAAIVALCCLSFSPQEGRKMASAEIKTLEGKAIDAATIQNDGKPMIVFVWEVTCQPCIKEFNAIAPMYDSWKAETGVKIVAISVDDSRSSSRVKPLVRARGWSYDVYLDSNQSFKRAMNVPLCPYAFIMDGNGNVVWQKSGYSPGDEAIIYETVKKYAGTK